MNKKVGIMAAVCVAVIVFIVVLLFKTADMGMETDNSLQLEGTWKVATCDGEPRASEYFVFSETDVNYYKDGNSEPVLTSAYEFSTRTRELKLKDTELVYVIDSLTNNAVVFRDAETGKLWNVCRYNGDGYTPVVVDQSVIEGDWIVIIHGNSLAGDEKLSFENGTFKDIVNGQVKLESAYTWTEDGKLSIDGAGLQYEVCPISETTTMLVDISNGYIWEIERPSGEK